MSLDSVSGKKYGLIIPSKRPTKEPIRINPAENAFAEESDEEDAKFPTKINLEKALEEDASVFQYDEVYDEISREKDQKLLEKSLPSARKSKYVGKLLQASAVRKLEKELLTERKAQRELEAEQEKYGDKESFVTGAYKKKMAELRELVERRREEEAREEVMDVTKQDGLGGFYRYMFQQKTASRRTPSPTSTSFGTSKPQTGSSEKDVTAERSSSRTQKPSPPRHRREDEDANVKRPPSSRPRSPSPRRGSVDRPRHSEHRRHPGEEHSSSRHRHHHRRGDSGDRRSHRDQRRRSRSHSRHSRRHDDRRRREDGGMEGEEKGGRGGSPTEALSLKKGAVSKIAAPPSAAKLPPPPPGFIHAKPRKTTEEEVEAARQRFLARKAAGLTRPTVVVSDDEA
ncbi:coiled coil domain containing protein [Echinococcus multilocularis]|uniref:Nuclear speckle splicing regulatory protein n=1 Tax=Echinococcus multilocularis TaxID=6211 RepID=A0A068Y4N1_ECHMU|nr:coiled coil domain containing protein [Echinococcus multilocularis]